MDYKLFEYLCDMALSHYWHWAKKQREILEFDDVYFERESQEDFWQDVNGLGYYSEELSELKSEFYYLWS